LSTPEDADQRPIFNEDFVPDGAQMLGVLPEIWRIVSLKLHLKQLGLELIKYSSGIFH